MKSTKQVNVDTEGVSRATQQFQESPFGLSDFILPERLQAWCDQDCQPTLILVGEAGTCKTVFCITIARERGLKLLICNHIEGLKDLTDEHTAILFDDFSFKSLEKQQLLAVLATDQAKQLRVLHSTVTKPPGLVQMITLNPDALDNLTTILRHRQYSRRICIVFLEKPLIFNLNLNIVQIHNHTHIYNNPENIAESYTLTAKR